MATGPVTASPQRSVKAGAAMECDKSRSGSKTLDSPVAARTWTGIGLDSHRKDRKAHRTAPPQGKVATNRQSLVRACSLAEIRIARVLAPAPAPPRQVRVVANSSRMPASACSPDRTAAARVHNGSAFLEEADQHPPGASAVRPPGGPRMAGYVCVSSSHGSETPRS